MPLTESPPDALAEVYARSLFELAEAKSGQALVERLLGELEDVLELARSDSRFNEFLASRVLPVADRRESLRRIFSGKVHELALNFLLLLNDKGRLAHLPPIVASLDSIVQERFGRIEVDVFTATPIAPGDLQGIRDRLRDVLGKEPVVHPYTDASMIGGVKLQIGDRLYDASVATRLAKFRDQLSTRGAAEVRGRADRIIDRDAPSGE